MTKAIAVALAVIACLLAASPASGADELKWSPVSIPTEGDIVALAVSPQYGQDSTLFMVTWSGGHSLWHSSNGGRSWETVLSTASGEEIDRVELPPNYGRGREVVFVTGSSNGEPAMWQSTDNGERFTRLSLPGTADAWAVVGDRTLFISSYNGNNGVVYRTSDGGLSYTAGVVVGAQSLNSIAVSPNYSQDKTILVGNTDGWVFLSRDNGASFQSVPADASSPPLGGGVVTVAFDPKFSSNGIVYAASDTPGKGIHRFKLGRSTDWEPIDTTIPQGARIGQLRVATNGALYATNFKAGGGLERSLNPAYYPDPTFETAPGGLDNTATLTGLWLTGNRLWAIDTTNARLLSYTDTLALPVVLTSPPDRAPAVGRIASGAVSAVTLDWRALSGATSYDWQLDNSPDFARVPSGFEGHTKATSVRLPSLKPGSKYYWRVRAIEPLLSPWSPEWSFTTGSDTGMAAPKPYAPEADASGISITPAFQWSAVAGANDYELLVATDRSFTDPIITRVGDYAIASTAWECDTSLSYGNTYYWKVRAIGSTSSSAWSQTYTFTTELPPQAPPPPTPAPPLQPPAPPPAASDHDTEWLWFLGGALLAGIVAILVTLTRDAVRRRP